MTHFRRVSEVNTAASTDALRAAAAAAAMPEGGQGGRIGPRHPETDVLTHSHPARASGRALFGAGALGASLGLAMGGAYLAGGLARLGAAHAPSPAYADLGAAMAGGDGSATGPAVGPRLRSISLGPAATAPLRRSLDTGRDLQCLSQAVYYEARGESETGQAAVAQVVLNRVRHPHYPKSVCGVVFQHAGDGCQFSFACDGATRRAVEGSAWRRAERIASRALTGFVMREVGPATDFRAGGLAAAGMARVAQVGGHVFYRFGGRGAPAPQAPEPTPERTVLAAFAPPSAEQLISAGVKMVERAKAAVGLPGHPPGHPDETPAAPPPAPGPSTVPVKVEASATAAKADVPAPTPAP